MSRRRPYGGVAVAVSLLAHAGLIVLFWGMPGRPEQDAAPPLMASRVLGDEGPATVFDLSPAPRRHGGPAAVAEKAPPPQPERTPRAPAGDFKVSLLPAPAQAEQGPAPEGPRVEGAGAVGQGQ